MSQQNSLRVAREWFEAVNAHDLDHIATTLDEEFVWELGDVVVKGRAVTEEIWQSLFSGFPDLRIEIEQMTVGGHYVVTRWRMTATHQGELMSRHIS